MKVSSDILKVYRSLHLWTGIIAGTVLFIGFFAGSLSMFKPAIDRWITPPQEVLQSIPIEKYDQLINQVQEKHPSAKQGFTLYLDHQKSQHSPMVWFDEAVDREINLDVYEWQGSLNAQDELITQKVLPSALANLIDLLHRTGGIPGGLGHEFLGVYILGIAAVLYFLALVSGLILLLPSLVKTFFALRDKNKLRFWLDAHNVVGITSFPFHVVISLTVIVFAFHDQFYDSLESVVYGEQPLFNRAPADAKDYQFNELLSVDQLLKKSQAIASDYEVTEMNFVGLQGKRPIVRLSLLNTQEVVRGPITDYAFFHPYNGTLINTTFSTETGSAWNGIVATFFALHFGSYGGDWVRWVYFFLGFSGAFLFYSGNLLWLEKRRIKQKKSQSSVAQRKACYVMASVTVGVCLGSMLAVCVTMLLGKWLHNWVDNINHAYLFVYYIIFLSSVVWAFFKGAARSSVHLLNTSALAALALPITSILALLPINPDIEVSYLTWSTYLTNSLGIDLVALLFSGIFYYGAKRTQKRAESGDKDSVWALQAEKQTDDRSDKDFDDDFDPNLALPTPRRQREWQTDY